MGVPAGDGVGDGEEVPPPSNGEPDPSGDGEGVSGTEGNVLGDGDSRLVGEADALGAGDGVGPDGDVVGVPRGGVGLFIRGVGVAGGAGITGNTSTRFLPLAAIAPIGALLAEPISTNAG